MWKSYLRPDQSISLINYRLSAVAVTVAYPLSWAATGPFGGFLLVWISLCINLNWRRQCKNNLVWAILPVIGMLGYHLCFWAIASINRTEAFASGPVKSIAGHLSVAFFVVWVGAFFRNAMVGLGKRR